MNTAALPPMKTLKGAEDAYARQFGSSTTERNFLRLTVALLSLGFLWALAGWHKESGITAQWRPPIVRINQATGQTELIQGAALDYTPQAVELKYFLADFVHKYWARNRATVRDDYSKSLAYLSESLAGSRISQNRKTKEIENFLLQSGQETEISIDNIVLPDLRSNCTAEKPCKATVDFTKHMLTGNERAEIRTERATASFLFVLTFDKTTVDNPLGLTIVYFREDQALS